jgi:hypothetical protein
MESGHWSHSTAEVDICTGWDGMSITLPRGVDTPLAINIDGSPVYFRNRLFQYHVNKGGMFSPVQWAWDDRGFTATAMEIIQPSQLVAIAEVENDVGKVIRVLGTNDGNVPLRSQLENGTGVDGVLIPINSKNDFPLGVILPPDQTIETRSVAIDPITRFTTTTPHQLTAGQGFNIASFTGTIPVPLSSGQVVYIGVIDAVTIQLFSDQNNAKNGNFPIKLQSIINSGTLTIKDSKPSNVVTALRFPALPANEPSLPITTANPVAFPQQTLPPPLLAKVTYFANLIDPKNLQIFTSFQDAQNNVNPVYTTGSTNPINIDIRKEILPETKFTFSIQHFYKQGDQVQAYTAGGTLPNPLIPNQNYFVNVINELTITLHESQADAIASTPTNPINPIKIIDAGVGSNFLVKLIASTFRSGELLQVTAPGLNIPAPKGAGASFQAVVTGSVRSVSVVAQGNGYLVVPQVTFSEPPEPPFGSGQEVKRATGFAIINTASTKLEQIIILDPGLGYTSAPSITIDAPTGPTSPSQATATATIQTSFVSYFRKISGGIGYTQSPQIQISGGGGSGATGQAIVNTSILPIASIVAPSTTATATTSSPHGFSEGQIVTISGASPAIYNGNKTILSVPIDSIAITSIVRTNTIALVTTGVVEHNYSTGQQVTISNAVTGVTPIAGYNGTFSIVVINPTQFQYTVSGSLANATSATSSIPSPAGNTFTFTVPVLTGDAVVAGNVFSGEVVAVNVITSGTGYTSSPTVTITPSTGVFIEFSSTGTLPSPLISGVAYRAESPLDTTNGVFTIKNADFSKVNVTGGGSGTFYTVLSRSFGVDFTDRWLGDFSSLSTGDAIYFGSDFILPTTVPSISSTVARFLNVITSGVSRVYNTAVNASAAILIDGNSINVSSITSAITTATVTTASNHWYIAGNSVTITGASVDGYNKSNAVIISVPALNQFTYEIDTPLGVTVGTIKVYKTTGLIQIVSFGVGQTYYGRRYSVSPLPYNDLIEPDSIVNLKDDQIVRFSTSSILPSPLVINTDYKIKLFGDSVKAFDATTGALIPLTTAGTGRLSLDIERTITPSKSTQIYCERSLFETGQAINVRAVEGDSLPNPLVATTTYFVRRVDENNFELYGTAAQAKATATTGRIEFQTSGDSVESTFFIDASDERILVKTVSQIEKPLTDGFVLLYAWDYGRSNDMTLIGRYHPSEVNPQYRRLRIGQKCAWVRLAYRMSPPFITSTYDYIPVEHERAIIAAVHACDMEDKDFADQATRYWGIAFNYLRNQQEYIDGHAMVPPQINNVTFGDGTDPVIF